MNQRFEEQDKRIEQRFEEQDEKLDTILEAIDERIRPLEDTVAKHEQQILKLQRKAA